MSRKITRERFKALGFATIFAWGYLLLMIPGITLAQSNFNEAYFKDRIKLLAGNSMFIAAKEFDVNEIMNKDLNHEPDNSTVFSSPIDNVAIQDDPNFDTNEPALVANPRNKKNLIAASHFSGPGVFINACVAYYSLDAGETWSAPIPMPLLTPSSYCSDPVLAFAPDGSRAYFAYMDIKITNGFPDWDIVVSYSDDGGQTWTGPIVALDAVPGSFIYDKCWIGTHVAVGKSQANKNMVYVTATQFDVTGTGVDHIAFARSTDKGQTWSAPTLIDASVPTAFPPIVLQGSRPVGGLDGHVLVAYYHSGADGWLTGSMEIRVAHSSNYGASFSAPVTAVVDNFELPFWEGPFAFYRRWWGSMFPDVAIDAEGSAHIVYTHDPVDNIPFPFAVSTTAEDGDIRYIRSSGPPYTSWTSPRTLNDDGLERAQGYASVDAQKRDDDIVIHVMWEDHRLSPETPAIFPNSNNLLYDIFYTRNVKDDGHGWFPNVRLSDESSFNDFIFTGDYNGLASNSVMSFCVWTDRRHQGSIFSLDDNIFGTRISPGGSPFHQFADAGQQKPTIESVVQLPEKFALLQNYPNPFNPETQIRFQLPEASHVVLKIFNPLGIEIRTLAEGSFQPGYYQIRWDGRDAAGRPVPSGLYFYKIVANNFTQVKKMSLLR
ncbi:MAG: T9SS C-terminal target domain-containing protein [Calditrichaeota bacterium]|nr:MAG: T9SS C-terminal target domain-containing protein [Calditrichota bacterium]